MNVVRASVAGAHALSVNVRWAGRLTQPLWFWVVLNVMLTVAATSTPPVLLLQGSVMNAKVRIKLKQQYWLLQCPMGQLWNLCWLKCPSLGIRPVFQTGLQVPTVSTAVQAASVLPWLVAVAVFLVSVMVTVILSEASVTTRQANATAPTILRDHTVNPACLVTTETPGMELFYH